MFFYFSKPPPSSLRPPVTHYHINHNLTSSDGSIIHNITNNITQVIFNSISYGNKYSVTVTAENVVGQGPGVNIEGIWRQTYDSNMFPYQ